jgi:hypothetical protein
MDQGHPSDAMGNIVQWSPQGLNYFSIDLLCSWNVAWRKPGQAGILMAMDME